jgi:imidazole glycerol-phosphate synthase subunit HisH
MIAIIDYGLGNLGSIQNMLKFINEKSVITSDIEVIKKSDKLILPGVGSFDEGMEQLEKKNLIETIRLETINGKPLLGICLGMQLLGQSSEEGSRKGLSLIPFKNIRFNNENFSKDFKHLKVPHMGWNIVNLNKETIITKGIVETPRYYFVHSYHAICENSEDILMTSNYGYDFTAAVQKGNVIGVQFHPEKSHEFGMKILENFARM